MKRHLWTGILSVIVCILLLGTSGIAQKSAAKGKPGGGIDTKARQSRPIQLGTSGGNALDVANGYCCSGTLGALVAGGNGLYILSNTHVLAGDSVGGGNGRSAGVGDPVNQPGLVDVGCANRPADYVAGLSDWSDPSRDNVDAGIAQINPGAVDTSGAILGIGPLSSLTASASVGQAVKKTGRTTGLSRSTVSSLNATLSVSYTDECAGDSFVVRYTGQILIENRGSRFLNSGDSGSLMVEDVASTPRAVGLLYAGSSSIAVANPIQDVLGALKVNMVGTAVSSAGGTGAEGKNAGANAQGLARAMEVQARNSGRLMSVPGAVGHAVGFANSPVIKVLVEELTPGAQGGAPTELEGVPVVVEEIGQVRALPLCVKQTK